MREEWAIIPDTDKLYEASNFGGIRRVLGEVDFGSRKRKIGGTILKPKTKNNGYKEVNIFVDKKGRSRYVHRLVVAAFMGRIPSGLCVNHKDGDKANNNLNNLEIVTHSQNMIHAFENKLKIPHRMQGDAHPNSKLTTEIVRSARNDYDKGMESRDVAIKYNTNISTMRKVLYRTTWTHI